MRLLLLSNSTNSGEKYLQHALPVIKDFIGEIPKRILFIPYAAVTIDFDEFTRIVDERFNEINHSVIPLHQLYNAVKAINDAEIIVVGGGNTFRLLKMMQENNIIEIIRQKVMDGTSFIGWSAGANVACPTIRTTNDMPVVQPDNFNALINTLPNQQMSDHHISNNCTSNFFY